MIVGIIGSRNWPETETWQVYCQVANLSEFGTESFRQSIVIISGGAQGVDTHAKKAAKQYGLKYKEYPPDMTKGYEVAQYHIRNDQIIKDADKIIAFWDGKSKGTKSVIDKCLERHKWIEVFFPTK